MDGRGEGVGGGGDVKKSVGGELEEDDEDIPLSPHFSVIPRVFSKSKS